MSRARPGLAYIGSIVALSIAVGTAVAIAEEAEPPAAGDEPVKQIKMYAENWKWTPDRMVVPKGTRVVITIDSRDAPHSFVLKEYGLKVKLPQDRTTRVEFVADKAGEFRWKCGRPCGDGCPKMRGTLTVTE